MSEERPGRLPKRTRRYPLLITLIFVMYAVIWVLLIGLLDQFRLDLNDQEVLLHVAVDAGFIVLTAVTLYVIVNWVLRRNVKATHTLVASETRYQQLFFDTFAVLLLIDPITGQIVDANPAACKFYGYPHDELTTLSLNDLDARSPDAIREGLSWTDRQNRRLEIPHRLASGEVRSVEIYATPIEFEGDVRIYAIVHDVSARREAQTALRHSELRFSNVFEQSMVGMALVSLMGEIQQVNAAFATFLGYQPDELRGRRLLPLIHPEDRGSEPSMTSAAVSGQVPTAILEKRFLRKNGATVWGRLTTSVMLDGDQPVSAFCMVQDITAERQHRNLIETLREVGALLISRLSPEEVLDSIFDLLATVVDYDSVSIQLIDPDRSLQLIKGRGFPDLEESKEIAKKILAETLEMRWRNADVMIIPDTHNDERWVVSGNEYIRCWIGVALRVRGALVGVMNVDSATPFAYDQATADTILTFANQAAIAIENARLYTTSQRRNDRLTILNRITRSGTTLTDLDDLLVEIADTVPQIIGVNSCLISLWDEQQDLPYAAADSGELHERYRRVYAEPGERSVTDRVLQEGKPIVIQHDNADEYISPSLRNRSEAVIPTQTLLAMPMQVGDRRIGAMMLDFSRPNALTDGEITWAMQAAEVSALAIARAQVYGELEARVAVRTAELSAANAQLVALSHVKDEFVANVSHELRTPVASIKLYHHLLTARPDKRDTYLSRLDDETRRLEHIIEDLLYLSRMDQEEVSTSLLPVDVNELVSIYVIDRLPVAEARGLSLDLNSTADLPGIQGDSLALGQMFSALIANALNYTPTGGQITVGTALRTSQGQAQVIISIEDDGPGIPEVEQPRVFDRFFRGQIGRDSGAPGTGLGLAISKEIAERHGGGIVVNSPIDGGKGTRFVVWLPVDGDNSKE